MIPHSDGIRYLRGLLKKKVFNLFCYFYRVCVRKTDLADSDGIKMAKYVRETRFSNVPLEN